MSTGAFLPFERAKFRTRLPRGHVYTAGHMWLQETEPERWQVGLTRFALRMLGEPVDLDFEAQAGGDVAKGQVVGWLEGFKAVTDLYSPMNGRFLGANPGLDKGLGALQRSGYQDGWLFALGGPLDPDCLDVESYAGLLTETIDRMVGENPDLAETAEGDPQQ